MERKTLAKRRRIMLSDEMFYEGYEQQNWNFYTDLRKAKAVDYSAGLAALILTAIISFFISMLITSPKDYIFFSSLPWAVLAIVASLSLLIAIVPSKTSGYRFFTIGLFLSWLGCKFIPKMF